MSLTGNVWLSVARSWKPGMPAAAPPVPEALQPSLSETGVKMGRWLAGKLMKDLDIASFQVPAHKYKRGGNEHVKMLNHLDRQFTVTAPDQVR